jgi:hypothetical protein
MMTMLKLASDRFVGGLIAGILVSILIGGLVALSFRFGTGVTVYNLSDGSFSNLRIEWGQGDTAGQAKSLAPLKTFGAFGFPSREGVAKISLEAEGRIISQELGRIDPLSGLKYYVIIGHRLDVRYVACVGWVIFRGCHYPDP